MATSGFIKHELRFLADEAIAVFKRCNVPEKVIKSTMKKDTTRNALLLTLAQAGVLQK